MGARIGTSGWSYQDWKEKVYPTGTRAADRLPFYARYLPTVEVNSTFYRDPSPTTVNGWVEKTAFLPHFEFTVKAPKAITQDALAKASPSECAGIARAWRERVATPLDDAHRLGAILMQLSPGVLHYEEPMARLDAVLDELDAHHVAVEFRNKSWLDKESGGLEEDAIALLDAHDAAAVIVDGPPFPDVEAGSASHAYVRWHGHNDDVWRAQGANKPENNPRDPRMNRYDYKYDEDALRRWARRLTKMTAEHTVVRGYFNNHPGGQAFHDALAMEDLLVGMRARVDHVPREHRVAAGGGA